MVGIILAAGLGERLRPITLKWAKPAVPFLNIPMISFPIFWLETLGLKDLVVNTHYLPETIRASVQADGAAGYRTHFFHEENILGSGGAIYNARSVLQSSGGKSGASGGEVIVANGDGVVLFPHLRVLEDMLAEHRKQNAMATILVCPHEGVGTRLPGVWVNAQDEVSHFGLEARPGLHCLHYASYLILSARVWERFPAGSSNILYDVLQPLIALGERVLAYNVPDMRWFETGNEADYLKATGECLKALSQSETGLSQLLSRFDSSWRTRASLAPSAPKVLVAEGAVLPKSVKVVDFAVVGRGSVISEGVSLERSVVLPGAQVTGDIKDQVAL